MDNKLSKGTLNKINIALQNLLENRAISEDVELIKRAINEGQIEISESAYSSVVVLGEGNSVRLTSDQAKLLTSETSEKAKSVSIFESSTQDLSIGRQTELKSIVTNIRSKTKSVNVLFGMGGVGKTHLAIKVINELKDECSYLFETSLINRPPISDIIEEVFNFISPKNIFQNSIDSEIIQTNHQVLQHQKIILFFDNVELISQAEVTLLVKSTLTENVHIIIASRKNFEIPGAAIWEINGLQPEESVLLLKYYYPSLETNQALEIAGICGNHPLALKMVGAQLNEMNISPREIISNLSREIFGTRDSAAVIAYLSRLSFQDDIQRRQVNEAKILFIGQGNVGKTSLIRQIVFKDFSSEENKTEGISILHWQLDSNIVLNIWDFGGQEIMHATHQFFLTKRSLYLLVIDARNSQEQNQVEYWLKIIQSFGGESPVLIVGNKIDQHPLDIDRTGLQKKYPNIVGILETSAATGAGIEVLKSAITEQVNNLPHVRDLLPETWFTVKTKLEELGKQSNFITQEKYLDLCSENEVSDETSQRTLIGFLHDLGVVLHFQDDPRLEALGILNPQWVTNGVYKILNSHALFQNKGVLATSMLDEILNLPEYPRGKRLFIVDMMKKFELCYDIPYGYDVEPDKTFLVPDLLPKDQPELNFSGIPAFEYAYPVLPSSVITRFIVRMNQKIENHFAWRTGVVLKIGENKALVKADIEDRKITIAIDGLEHTRRDALSAIRYQLDEIHNSIKGLNPEKFVPIPGAESQRYDFLLQLEHDGVKMLPVPAKSGGKPIMVDVSQLLSGIESEAQRRENVTHVTTVYHVNTGGGDFTGGDKSISAGDNSLVIGGNVSDSRISASYNKIESAEIDPELKETMKQLADAVDIMLQKLPAEQATEVAEDYGKLVDEAVKPKPNQKWYSVTIEGLIKAAENLDKLGTPVISLSRKVLSLLTGG